MIHDPIEIPVPACPLGGTGAAAAPRPAGLYPGPAEARAAAQPLPSGRTTGAAEQAPTCSAAKLSAHPEEPRSGVSKDPSTYVPVAALEAVLAERMRQIHTFGHTPQADAELPLKQLPRAAQRFLTAAIEDCQFQRGDWRKAARKHLIRAAAMILAAIDRVEAEPEEDPFILSLSKDER